MQTLRAQYDGWTVDDLAEAPDDGVRREIIDGVLITTPPPSVPHQHLAWRLSAVVNAASPSEYAVSMACAVRAGSRRAFLPDIVVMTREAAQRRPEWLEPADVVLAVEIVSAASISVDRVLKPALYASAGIPNYWRIEPTENYRLHAYALQGSGVYDEVAEFDGLVMVTQPFPMAFDLAAIKPD